MADTRGEEQRETITNEIDFSSCYGCVERLSGKRTEQQITEAKVRYLHLEADGSCTLIQNRFKAGVF